MFLSVMSNTEVFDITLPVPQPLTVTGWLFEFWCRHSVIPAMVVRGERFIVFDNARVHRRNVLRALFWAAGIEMYFSPPYSPWF
mmetsp:Transcript_27766/g.68295  ORF Transcript_27766/g.68295 Transcript_27766/m.68295 type:complete len:84 (-) Transcript_27766:244-495(-)